MNRQTFVESSRIGHAQGSASSVDASCIAVPSYAEALVDPGGTFRHPDELVGHPLFSHDEKRTILLSWIRDELLLEQVANRTMPELKSRSRIEAVLDALARFDRSAADEYRAALAFIGARAGVRPCCA